MNRRLTFQDMKELSKDDPEQYQEFVDIELENLKKQQMFYATTPVDQRPQMMKNNMQVRKEATKILKNYDGVNTFMYAKSWDSYLKKAKPFRALANNLGKDDINKDRKGLDTVVYYNEADANKPKPPKTITPTEDFKTPESEFQRVPEFMEKNMKPDPDLNKGIATILHPHVGDSNS